MKTMVSRASAASSTTAISPSISGSSPKSRCSPALLKVAPASYTVPTDMPSSRPTRRRRVERREVRSARRARRFALLTLLAIVLVIALLLSAFGGNARPVEPLSLATPP